MASAVSSTDVSTVSGSNPSVFKTGYPGKSIAVHGRTYEKKAYIKGNNTFWAFMLMEYTEVHQEFYSLHDTLADTVVIHATGARPIEVTMQGYFAAGAALDTRMDFLHLYANDYRPSLLQGSNREVQVFIRDTMFKLLITSVSVQESVEVEDHTLISIVGRAYQYKTVDGADFDARFAGNTVKSYAEVAINLDASDKDAVKSVDIGGDIEVTIKQH